MPSENDKVTSTIDEGGIEIYRNEKGERHRTDGPAIIWPDGTKFWCQNDKFHREDGPAIEWSHGGKEWRLNGLWHREDGPASEWPDGRKWWAIHGKPITEKEFTSQDNSQ